VDFIEIAARAGLALGEDEAPTDLAQALDYAIRHLLVDEFQDTSPTQVGLLQRLTRGWLPDDGRTLFVVGDPMQSIYRFRKADVGLFLRVRERGIGSIRLEHLRLYRNKTAPIRALSIGSMVLSPPSSRPRTATDRRRALCRVGRDQGRAGR
jgi:ATP-dependent exoDNAse (exonuclease V) beta subunit